MHPTDEPSETTWLAISEPDYLWFTDLALNAMVSIVQGLGDEKANRRPEVSGANAPYVVLTHCLGVMEFWGGALVAERTVTRDREAEFHAEGAVGDLIVRAVNARRQFEQDISGVEPLAAPPRILPPEDDAMPYSRTKGAVLLHVLEELFQHLGQMELARDVLLDAE